MNAIGFLEGKYTDNSTYVLHHVDLIFCWLLMIAMLVQMRVEHGGSTLCETQGALAV